MALRCSDDAPTTDVGICRKQIGFPDGSAIAMARRSAFASTPSARLLISPQVIKHPSLTETKARHPLVSRTRRQVIAWPSFLAHAVSAAITCEWPYLNR